MAIQTQSNPSRWIAGLLHHHAIFAAQSIFANQPHENWQRGLHGASDLNKEVRGWWFYLNFSAARVPMAGSLPDTVFADGFE